MNHADAISDWAMQWRKPMLRFALLHLQPREDAEDTVQDTLVAMLDIDINILQQSDPKRYLFGILRHKITDKLRKRYRTESSYHDVFDDDIDNELFDVRNHWIKDTAPQAWNCPETELQTDQFFAVVDICMQNLPAKPARVFSMKEFLGCETDEICITLNMSKSDYWQCMSRARKQIQLCLNQNWFEGATL